jgi:L-fuculose-phosphate aldolase
MDSNKYKNEVADFMKRLYFQKLTTSLGGNISLRLSDNTILITPSGSDKGTIESGDIGRLDFDSNIIGKNFKPSIETQMHIEIYKSRPDINAIVHAHPVTTCAFSATDAQIKNNLIIESFLILGEIAYASYFPIGTKELANEVSNYAKTANCIIMKNHGAVTLGSSMLEAFDRLEVLENAAKMSIMTGVKLEDQPAPL